MPNYSEKGYTLIELLIVMTIMVILFSVGYASFRDYSRRQIVNSFSRRVRADLSLAREKAISGEKPDNILCDSPNTLNGYNFRIVTEDSYVIEAVCSEGLVEVKEVLIEESLALSVPENPIFFKVLSKGTNLSSDEEIIITQEGTENINSIFISQSGEIK